MDEWTHGSDDSLSLEICQLVERKVDIRDANWSMRWFGLVLLHIGKPAWFWAPIVLVAAGVGALWFFQAIILGIAALVAAIVIGWYVEYSWIDWVEEHNVRLEARIAELHNELRSEPRP